MFWNVLECFGMFWNVLEFFGMFLECCGMLCKKKMGMARETVSGCNPFWVQKTSPGLHQATDCVCALVEPKAQKNTSELQTLTN